MKKPKFNQLRGTYAHALRHRICLGITLCVAFVGYFAEYGLTKLVPEPGGISKSIGIIQCFRLDPTKKNVFRGVGFDDS